jgi:hypothetical protein
MTTPLTGAGTTFAGAGPAGLDPVGSYSSPGILSPIDGSQVALFDLASRSVPRDLTTFLVKRVHWVDQAVALALGITNGKLSSQPTLGNRLRLIGRNDPQRLEAEVKDAVRVALLALTSRRDIVVTNIQITQPIRSQMIVAVWYLNLRISPAVTLPDNIAFVF